MKDKEKSLLIYAPVPLYQREDILLLEDQATNGLRLWSKHFESVSVIMPLATGPAPDNWQPLEGVEKSFSNVNLIPVPMAYRPDRFAKHFRRTRDVIRKEIDHADYLSFSIGGLFGDWGSVACYEAHRKGRKYAVWTDRVESQVVRQAMHSGPFRRRLQSRLYHRPMAYLERFLIKRATLGLFHGRETYETYAPFCSNPQIVHDIHIKASEHISSEDLTQKTRRVLQSRLKIIYVGRAVPMKGGMDWVSVLGGLSRLGVQFQATWLGDGPDLPAMQRYVSDNGLEESVSLAGFIKDRAQVLEVLRAADIFLFCHKTPESPRCLIEALVSGVPIVGYRGAFAQDLIYKNQGGYLVAPDDTAALIAKIYELDHDRETLGSLIFKAAQDGSAFDDETVFEHRSELIQKYLR